MSFNDEAAKPRKRKTVWIAAGVLVVVVLVVLGVALMQRSDDDSSSGQTGGEWETDLLGRDTFVPNEWAGTVLPQREPSGDRTEWSDGTEPITAPQGVQLQSIGNGVQVPVSTSDGPTDFAGNDWRTTGYAHTGQGAVLFALDTRQRALADPSVGDELFAERVTDPDLMYEVESDSDGVAELDDVENTIAALAPKYVNTGNCSPNRCEVKTMTANFAELSGEELPLDHPGHRNYVSETWNLVWDNGEWKAESYGVEWLELDTVDGWQTWY